MVRKRINDIEVSALNGIRAGYSLEFCYSHTDTQFKRMVEISDMRDPLKQAVRQTFK